MHPSSVRSARAQAPWTPLGMAVPVLDGAVSRAGLPWAPQALTASSPGQDQPTSSSPLSCSLRNQESDSLRSAFCCFALDIKNKSYRTKQFYFNAQNSYQESYLLCSRHLPVYLFIGRFPHWRRSSLRPYPLCLSVVLCPEPGAVPGREGPQEARVGAQRPGCLWPLGTSLEGGPA